MMKSFNINTDIHIVYCDKCGEYLGDEIKGQLWKFGHPVLDHHACKYQGYRIRNNFEYYIKKKGVK